MNNRLQLKRELLEYYVLTDLTEKEANGAEIYKDIKPHMHISVNDVYDVLHDLEKEGKVISRKEKKGGRKYIVYSLTLEGMTYQEQYTEELDERLHFYREACAKDRYWPGFTMGILFPIWFPFFLIAFLFVLAFSIVFIAVAFALPGVATAAFGYFGVKLFIAAFTTYMAKGIVAVILAVLIALLLCALCLFWAWLTVRFVKYAARVSRKAFRGLFGLLAKTKN